MTEPTSTLERRGLAKGLKVWIDILFGLCVLSAAVITVMWPIAELTDQGAFQLRIPVSIGESSLLPIHELEVNTGALERDMGDTPRFALVNTRGELRFSTRGFGPSFVYLLITIALAGIVISGLFILRQILTTAVQGRPFHPSNPHRLNALGWLITLTGAGLPVLQYHFSRWVLSQVELTGTPVRASLEFQKEWIFCGLLVLVLASIWKQAVRMAEEQSLTV